MNPEQFFYKVKEMRDAQKEYFKYRTKSALEKSKKLEAAQEKHYSRNIHHALSRSIQKGKNAQKMGISSGIAKIQTPKLMRGLSLKKVLLVILK